MLDECTVSKTHKLTTDFFLTNQPKIILNLVKVLNIMENSWNQTIPLINIKIIQIMQIIPARPRRDLRPTAYRLRRELRPTKYRLRRELRPTEYRLRRELRPSPYRLRRELRPTKASRLRRALPPTHRAVKTPPKQTAPTNRPTADRPPCIGKRWWNVGLCFRYTTNGKIPEKASSYSRWGS